MTLVDGDNQRVISEELCQQPTHPGALLVEGGVLVAHHSTIVPPKAKVEVLSEDGADPLRVNSESMKMRLNGIDDLGPGEVLDPKGIHELGHCLLDLGPLLRWYMVVVEVLGLVGAELSADLHRLGVVHFEALVGSVHILN